MTPEEFARIESLFHAATMQPPEARARFLEQAEPDPAIRAAAMRLLDRDAAAETDPLSARLEQIARVAPPRAIGPYRLLRELGAGGMGTVFLAERDVEGTAQQVALKLLHGLPTEAGKRRMARERGLLASLNHPQIAGLIDGGETADGQPYLVMEYVEGLALSEFLSTTHPSLTQRLKLYLQLCDAVQHAHQRLVLHRDLKPSNVMVRIDGTPVLLDFGVGKLLEESEQPAHTATLAFTPGYSASEQRRGEPATTATDVFGLGALLFDLLTDRRLSDLRKGETPVPTPSSQTLDPAKRRALRGDLDRIVRKATAEDPAERYKTIAALADDVQRYLQGQPIAAAPDVVWYRLRKFAARHRVAVAACVVAIVAAGLFVWRLDTERQRALAAERIAEREAAYAKASRDFLASVLAETSPDAVRGQPITIATLLANASKKLQADHSQDAKARAIAWLTIAEVYADINDPQPGLIAVDKALTLFKQAASADLELQARALRVRGSILTQLERIGEARRTMQRVIALRQRQGAGALVLASAYNDYAATAMHDSDFEAAEHYDRVALNLLESTRYGNSDLHIKILLGLTGSRLYKDDIGRAALYLARAEAAAKTTQNIGHPLAYKLHRITALVRHGQHRYEEAISHANEALRLAYLVYGQRSRLTWDMETYLAWILDDIGHPRAAIAHYERAQTIAEALDLGNAIVATGRVYLAIAYENHADYAKAAALAKSALPLLPDGQVYIPWQIRAQCSLGVSLSALGKFPQAQFHFERALELAQAYKGRDALVGYAFVQLRHAQALLDAHHFAEAEVALDAAKSVEQSEDLYPMGLTTLRSLEASLALAHNDVTLASQQIARAVRLAEKYHRANTMPMAKLKLVAARIEFRQGNLSQARQLLNEALPVLQRELWPNAPQLVEGHELVHALSSIGNRQPAHESAARMRAQ